MNTRQSSYLIVWPYNTVFYILLEWTSTTLSLPLEGTALKENKRVLLWTHRPEVGSHYTETCDRRLHFCREIGNVLFLWHVHCNSRSDLPLVWTSLYFYYFYWHCLPFKQCLPESNRKAICSCSSYHGVGILVASIVPNEFAEDKWPKTIRPTPTGSDSSTTSLQKSKIVDQHLKVQPDWS